MRSDDQVQLVVGGSSYSRWLSVDMDSDIFTEADAFQVRARAPGPALVGAFREGMNLDLYVGGDRQMAGVIDEVQLEGTRTEETLSLVGRDKGAWLVDDEAETIRATGLTTMALIKKLLKPSFGIRNVILSYEADRKLAMGKKDRGSKAGKSKKTSLLGDVSAPRAKTKVDNGTKIAAQLNQHFRQLGVTWWLTPSGDLYVGKPNYDQDVAYSFVSHPPGAAEAKGNNVEKWSMVRSISDRFSKITVVGTGGGGGTKPTFGVTAAASKSSSFKAFATDPDLVARGIVRETIMGDGDLLNRQQAQRRADTEMGLRRLKGLTIHVTVAGFRQGDRLYTIDTLASVKIPTAGIDGVFYVVQRRFVEERARRRTELTLHQPKVWLA